MLYGYSFIEQPEILAIFGVMPLCLVFERKKRHSLQSRIRQKSSVEVLCCWTPLKGAESSAHCCGFFSVTSHKRSFYFFFFSLGGRACSSWTHAGRWKNETSAAARKRKTRKQNISGISVLDILKHQQQPTRRHLVFLWSATNNAERFIVKLCPHPAVSHSGFNAVASSQRLMGGGKLQQTAGAASSGVLTEIIPSCQHKHLFSGVCPY